MSEFILRLTHDGLAIYRWSSTDLLPDSVIGVRDPDKPIDWYPGHYYYNPIVFYRDPYIYRGDGQLVSINTGKPVPKLALKKPLYRTWFELIWQKLEWEDIHSGLKEMISAIPENKEAIAKGFLRYHSVRVPADKEFHTWRDWEAWADGIQVPFSDKFKYAMGHYNGPAAERDVLAEFSTGEIPVPTVRLRIRTFQIQQVVRTVRVLVESPLVDVDVPKDISDRGYAEIKKWVAACQSKFPMSIASEEIVSDKTEEFSSIELAVFGKTPQGGFRPIYDDNVRTINNTIREILDENNPTM